MANILVLGGTGFIGREVVEYLKAKHKLVVTSQSENSCDIENIQFSRIEYNFSQIKNLFQNHNFDAAVFLSGNSYPSNSENSPFYEVEKTYQPFLSLLEVVRQVSPNTCIWCASSVAVYGENNTVPLSEDSKALPLSFYGMTKLQMEGYLQYYVRVHKLRGGILRIFSTYGPGLKRQLIYDIVKKMLLNKNKISLFGDGTEARDLSFILDQAKAISFLVENTIPMGDIYNIGSGVLYSVNEVVKKVASILEINPEVEFSPKRSFDGSIWKADISKLQGLGFKQDYSLDQGLRLTVSEIKNDFKK